MQSIREVEVRQAILAAMKDIMTQIRTVNMPFQEIHVTWTQWLPQLQSKLMEKSKDTGIWRTLGLDVVHEADH